MTLVSSIGLFSVPSHARVSDHEFSVGFDLVFCCQLYMARDAYKGMLLRSL